MRNVFSYSMILVALILPFTSSAEVMQAQTSFPEVAFKPDLNKALGLNAFRRTMQGLTGVRTQILGAQARGDVNAIVKLAGEGPVRGYAFQLQGLARLYLTSGLAPFEDLKKKFKKLEDTVGQFSLSKELLQAAQKNKLGTATQQRLISEGVQARQTFLNELGKTFLVDSKEWAKVSQFIENWKWESPALDRKRLLTALAKEAEELAKDIGQNKFDDADIEKGLHELRRKLRWQNIDLLGLNGFVLLDNKVNPIPAYAALLSDAKLVNSKYTLFSTPIIANPIRQSQSLTLAIAKLVDQIGKVKDKGEAIEQLAQRAVQVGEYPDLATAQREIEKKINQNSPTPYIPHRQYAQQIQAELRQNGLMTVYQRLFTSQQ